jgi:outer membrane protein, heavy metal efflux system
LSIRLLMPCAAALLLWGAPGRSQQAPPRAQAETPAARRDVPRARREAPVTPPLLLETVLASVRAHHPQLMVARQTVAAAEGTLMAAEGGFDTRWQTRAELIPEGYYERRRVESIVEQPTPLWGTRLLAGYRLGTGDFPTYYGQQETLSLGEVRAGVEVPLWRGGPIDRLRADLARARLNREAADFSLGSELLVLERDATHAYWTWVSSGQQLTIYRELLELARVRNAQLITRVRRGDLPQVEQTENERVLRMREADLVAARRRLEQAALRLALFLRDDQGQPVVPGEERVPEAMPLPDLEALGLAETWVERALERRPELQELRLQRRIADVDVELAQNLTAPAVDVGLFVSRDFGVGPERLRPTEVQAGLRLDIPLQNRVARGQRNAASARRAAVDARAWLLRDRVVTGVQDALSALQAAAERVTLARDATSIARQLAQAERVSFELGNTTLLIVNLREEMAANAEVSELQALADYQRALADLWAVTGLPSEEWTR